MVNVEDDQPELIFCSALEGQSEDSDVAPFYISLRLHDYVLHNAMFDSGASHNLMPKEIMEKLGLDITRKYHDLYSFDSSRVRCIGLIKDLVVTFDQIPRKNVLMDVVVANIPPRFGMLLYRSWGAKLKRDIFARFLLWHYSRVWSVEEIISGEKHELYDHKEGETFESSN